MKGKYYVELYDGDRRRSLWLRTDNYELACQRYAAGLKELRKKIRAEHEAAKPQERLAWLPEEVEAIKNQYEGTGDSTLGTTKIITSRTKHFSLLE